MSIKIFAAVYGQTNDDTVKMITAQKIKFFIKDFYSKWPNPQFRADLVTFTEENLNVKHHFFWAVDTVRVLYENSEHFPKLN